MALFVFISPSGGSNNVCLLARPYARWLKNAITVPPLSFPCILIHYFTTPVFGCSWYNRFRTPCTKMEALSSYSSCISSWYALIDELLSLSILIFVKNVYWLGRQRLEFGGGGGGEFAYVSSLVSAIDLVAKAYLRTEVYFWCKQQIFRDCPYMSECGRGKSGRAECLAVSSFNAAVPRFPRVWLMSVLSAAS